MSELKTMTTPFLVVGDKRRRQLQERIAEAARRWHKQWCADSSDARPDVVLESAAAAILKGAGEYARFVVASIGDVRHVVVAASAEMFAELLDTRQRSASTLGRPARVATAVCNEIASSFAQFIVDGLKLGQWELEVLEHEPVDVESRDWRSGWVASISWDGRSGGIRLSLSATCVDFLLPPMAKGNAAALARRNAAIADESIRLQAVLGETSISIGELTTLAVDDVLVLRDEISQPSQLLTSSGQRVANISIGRVAGKRAALVVKN